MDHYIPDSGDIVWIDFDLSGGKEIKKRRPALVISKYKVNLSTQFAVVCPITSTTKSIPTRVTLSKELRTKGQVIVSQLKSLDYTYLQLTYIEKISLREWAIVKQIVKYIFE